MVTQGNVLVRSEHSLGRRHAFRANALDVRAYLSCSRLVSKYTVVYL